MSASGRRLKVRLWRSAHLPIIWVTEPIVGLLRRTLLRAPALPALNTLVEQTSVFDDFRYVLVEIVVQQGSAVSPG